MIMRLRLALAAVLLLAAPRLAVAQTSPRSATDSLPHVEGLGTILLGELALETEHGGDSAAATRTARAANAVARAYRDAGRSPALADEIIARAVSNHFAGSLSAASAATLQRADEQTFRLMLLQAAQNARLVEQNDRIIELLQALAARH